MGEQSAGGMQRKRSSTLDVINVIACILVVCLHHNRMVHSFEDTAAWRQSLAVECIGYCAVPLFLMISGANLLGYREKYSTKVFIKKRVVRTVLPWLFWSVAILLLNVRLGILDADSLRLRNAADLILNYKVESVYWYFGTLFACYLAVPVLSAVRHDRKLLWFVAALNFIFISTLPIISQWTGFTWTLDVPVVGSNIIFIILGYLLCTEKPPRSRRLLIYAAGLAGLLFRWIYTYHYSVLSQTTDVSIKGYARFHSVLYACAVFVLLNQIDWDRILSPRCRKAIAWLSGCSFGVFLIHRRVMYFEMRFLGIGERSLAWRTVYIAATYLVSLLIVSALRKIRFLKWTVGG